MNNVPCSRGCQDSGNLTSRRDKGTRATPLHAMCCAVASMNRAPKVGSCRRFRSSRGIWCQVREGGARPCGQPSPGSGSTCEGAATRPKRQGPTARWSCHLASRRVGAYRSACDGERFALNGRGTRCTVCVHCALSEGGVDNGLILVSLSSRAHLN